MARIHASSIIEPGASIAESVTIGPFCVVGGSVTLEAGVELVSHVSVAGATHIGEGTKIFPFASLGHAPQDLKYKGEASQLTIGSHTVIREHVTMNTGTAGGGMLTRVGNNCLFMVGTHVAHDCQIGNHVIMANNATLGGHVIVEDFAIIGGLAAVHQFVRIGRHAIIGGLSGVENDVIPYGSVIGERAALAGLNLVGLKRRGFDRDTIHALRSAYRLLFDAESGTLLERSAAVREKFSQIAPVQEIVAFLDDKSSRAICTPQIQDARGHGAMTTNDIFEVMPETPLGIIAGGGDLPRQLLEACAQSGRSVFVIAIENETLPDTVEEVPHVWIKLGSIGLAIDRLKQAGVEQLVLAGKINRPSVAGLKLDMMGAKLISKLGLSLFAGDATIFKTIIAFLEDQGFRVIGIDDVLQNLIAPEGPMGRHLPDKQSQKDIELGAGIVGAIGRFDIGQAVIVKNALVLGIEAAEGTDALIERCSQLKGEGKGGVLVKARKPIQEDRVDLPTIGTHTIELIHQAGFAGIALEAHHSLVVARKEVIRLADAYGVFVIGFSLS